MIIRFDQADCGWYPVSTIHVGQGKGLIMSQKKEDKAAESTVEAEQDAAYKTYEVEQADHEKKHPGEIDEPAYAKYEEAYDKAEAKPVSAGRVKLNVPSSPVHAPGVPTHDEAQTIKLFHISEDGTSTVHTRVHPEMVGDYLRAGWSRA